MSINPKDEIKSIISAALNKISVKKIILSMPKDKSIKRGEITAYLSGGEYKLNFTVFTSDNKSVSKPLDAASAPEIIAHEATENYKRANIITSGGECSVMVSKKGKITVVNNIKKDLSVALELDIPTHNREKNYIINTENSREFLEGLGLCDKNGRIHDKKTSKFRQINKFVEILESVYGELPQDGELTVCDLCCGKSYLSFAVYFYLTHIKGRAVKMYGVDLKKDVIEFCNSLSSSLGFNIEFICDDISNFVLDKKADMVISLHACDIATDIVLSNAVRLESKVILSTPCCHHEYNREMKPTGLEFITKHSILKQKLADAVTDSVRCLALEAKGYAVTAFELIDPEETPKNVIIKAIFKNTSAAKRQKAYDEYLKTTELFGFEPTIGKLML